MNQPTTPSDRPRVTVLMPVYNAEAYLALAVESILDQTFDDWELVAVNDGSTDRSGQILEQYQRADPRVRVVDQQNGGIVAALNAGLARARGELIARMDADDLSAPQRLARQVQYLQNHPVCVALGSGAHRCDPTGSPTGQQQPPTDHAAIDDKLVHGDGSAMIHATMMIRTEALRAIGGWDPQYDWVEDLDLCLRLAERGGVANLPELLYTYRRHLQSVCATKNPVMYDRVEAVLRAAYQRRGIDRAVDLRALRGDLSRRSESPAGVYRNWACHAIHAGNPAVARQHAWAAMRRAPWSAQTWRVLYWSLAA